LCIFFQEKFCFVLGTFFLKAVLKERFKKIITNKMPIFGSDNLLHLQDRDIDSEGRLIYTQKVVTERKTPYFIMIQGDFCGHCRRAKPDFIEARMIASFSVLNIPPQFVDAVNKAKQDGISPVGYYTVQVDSKDAEELKLIARLKPLLAKAGIHGGGVPQFVLSFLDENNSPQFIEFDGERRTDGFLRFTSSALFR